MNRIRYLQLLGGLLAVVIVLSLAARVLTTPGTGTLVVVLSGAAAAEVRKQPLDVQRGGAWIHIAQVTAAVPAAPDTIQVAEVSVTAGAYTAVRLGSVASPFRFEVPAQKVQPLLLGVAGQSLMPGAAYAGGEAVNLGLGELGGRYTPIPPFELRDQQGRSVTAEDLRGAPTVVAAFHTTCRATCPLYTGLLLELHRKLGDRVHLAEVTTDPADTPAALAAYAKRIGISWELLTGTGAALQAFWAPFQVGLSSGDTHVSTLFIADSHGYVRLVYRGIPDEAVLPGPLTSQLDAAGLAELGHGDGWGEADVAASLSSVEALFQPRRETGGRAPGFSLGELSGTRISLAQLSGQPVVLNFWASYCPACSSELPQLVRAAAGQPGVVLLLLDERDDPGSARNLLAQLKIRAPVALDPDGKVGSLYGVEALPTTVFVRPDGTIAATYLGQLDFGTMAAKMADIAGA